MPNLAIGIKDPYVDYDCLCGQEFKDASMQHIINHLEQHFHDYLQIKNSKYYN